MMTKGYGLTVEDIDKSCPAELEPYEKAYHMAEKENDSKIYAWVGTYIRSALCFAIDHCLNGKKASTEYLKAPLMEDEEDRVRRLRNEFVKERLKAKQEWDRTHNMIDGKD